MIKDNHGEKILVLLVITSIFACLWLYNKARLSTDTSSLPILVQDSLNASQNINSRNEPLISTRAIERTEARLNEEQPELLPTEIDNYIVSCPEFKQQLPQEEIKKEFEQITNHWRSSTDPHEKINASIFTNDATDKKHIRALLSYHDQFPKSIITYDRLLDL